MTNRRTFLKATGATLLLPFVKSSFGKALNPVTTKVSDTKYSANTIYQTGINWFDDLFPENAIPGNTLIVVVEENGNSKTRFLEKIEQNLSSNVVSGVSFMRVMGPDWGPGEDAQMIVWPQSATNPKNATGYFENNTHIPKKFPELERYFHSVSQGVASSDGFAIVCLKKSADEFSQKAASYAHLLLKFENQQEKTKVTVLKNRNKAWTDSPITVTI